MTQSELERPVTAAEPAPRVGSAWLGLGADEAVSASGLIEMSSHLRLYPAWLPEDPRPIAGDSVIHDCGEPIADQQGGVLLLAGARPHAADTVSTVLEAASHGYSAVVVKARGESLAGLVQAAMAVGVALLVAPDEMSWRALDTLITTIVTAHNTFGPADARSSAGDLFALANAIAYGVGGATAIEDHRGRLFAHSNLPHQRIDDVRLRSITDRQSPSRDIDAERYRRVRHADGPIRFESTGPGVLGRLAVAVRAGGQLLGTIWVLDGDPPLREGAAQALEDAAEVAALQLLQLRQREDVHRSHRGELLASMLTGDISPVAAAALLDMPATMPTAVLAFAPGTPASARVPSPLGAARAVDLLNLYCEAWHPQAMCTVLEGTIFVLLPSQATGAGQGSISRFAQDVVATVERVTGLAMRVGIGPLAQRLEEIPVSRRLAELALEAIDSSDSPVAVIDKVRSRVIMHELSSTGVLDLTVPGDPLEQIREYDRIHASHYEKSLLAYLDSFGDAARAAKTLCIHENTLRYRVRRMEDMFDLDLDDPDTRLVTWLEMRLSQLSSTHRPGAPGGGE